MIDVPSKFKNLYLVNGTNIDLIVTEVPKTAFTVNISYLESCYTSDITFESYVIDLKPIFTGFIRSMKTDFSFFH